MTTPHSYLASGERLNEGKIMMYVLELLGTSQLQGDEIPSHFVAMQKTLFSHHVESTMQAYLTWLADVIREATELPDMVHDADPLEHSSYVSSVIHSLMGLWAVFLVLDDMYQQQLDGSEWHPQFHRWMTDVLEAHDRLDVAIEAEPVCTLLAGANRNLVSNLGRSLADPYRECLPWWLKGEKP